MMSRQGNYPRGQDHVGAKLTEEQALEIIKSTESSRELSRRLVTSGRCAVVRGGRGYRPAE